MSATKVAISIDDALLQRLDHLITIGFFRDRSEAVQAAVYEKMERMDTSALARECANLDPGKEQALADEGLASDLAYGPNIERRNLLGGP